MDVAYVEMVEDLTPEGVSTAEVRAKVDAELAGVLTVGAVARPVDREAWLRGAEAKDGQAAMLSIVKDHGRR